MSAKDATDVSTNTIDYWYGYEKDRKLFKKKRILLLKELTNKNLDENANAEEGQAVSNDGLPFIDQTIASMNNAVPKIQKIVMMSPTVARAGPVMLSGSYPLLNTR